MFDKLREIFRESQELAKLNVEFAEVCPNQSERTALIRRFREIHRAVPCPHNESHILTFIVEMLRFARDYPQQQGVFVEAGCFKGGSTAKISLIAKKLNRRFVVCDSFEGIPDNSEEHHKSIFGYSIENWFTKGSFAGSLDEVKANVAQYGELDTCQFIKGWFDDTLPLFDLPIAGAYIDVDLASSTKTCLKYFYPKLVPGGFIVSQDGDFPLVVEAIDDDRFWNEEVGCPKPVIGGLHTKKMLTIYSRTPG